MGKESDKTTCGFSPCTKNQERGQWGGGLVFSEAGWARSKRKKYREKRKGVIRAESRIMQALVGQKKRHLSRGNAEI